jgi:ribosomal protein L32
MAVPKRKTSKHGETREERITISGPKVILCPNCKEPALYQVCPKCGMYKGKKYLEVEET